MPELPIGDFIAKTVSWLQDNLAGLFDAIASVMTFLINQVLYVLTAPAWWVILVVCAALAFWARGAGLAVFTAAGFLVVQGTRLWPQAMATFALAIVATALAVVAGVPLGVWAARNQRVSATLRPILDFMQTLPVFVYLIPAVFFFGVGVVPATIATFIFATAPVVRLTELGIRQVDEEMVEASLAFGANPGQLLRQVQLPLAMPSIMAGVNQAIMMSLSMVVIAGMVGAGGLGETVVTGISRLDVGTGFEGGLGVVFLAIFLDRLTGAFPRPSKARKQDQPPPDAAAEAGGTPSDRRLEEAAA
jgi:glycine betaine/proline transport system permease protein